MKIYDKRSLVSSVLDVGLIIILLNRTLERGIISYAFFAGWLIVRLVHNLKATFTKEGHDEKAKKLDLKKRAYKKIFGRFSSIAPYSFWILLAVGLLLLKLFQGSMMGAYFIVSAPFAQWFVRMLVSDEIRKNRD